MLKFSFLINLCVLTVTGLIMSAAAQAKHSGGHSHQQQKSQSVEVLQLKDNQGFVRAMPPGQSTTAAFFNLMNNSDTDVVIDGIQSSFAKHVMIHSTVVENQVAKMRHKDTVTVPAGASFAFKPGATHVMLMHLQKKLIPDTRVDITLHYTDGKQQTFYLQIKKQ